MYFPDFIPCYNCITSDFFVSMIEDDEYFKNKINFLELCKQNFIPSTLNSRGVNIGFNLKFRSMKKNMEKVVTMLAVIMGFSVIALANIWIP